MDRRPFSVSVISWIVLIYSIVWILSYIAYHREIIGHLQSISTGMHYFYLGVATAVFNIVTSLSMLSRGGNWGRLFFTIWNTMMIIYSYVVAQSYVVTGSTFVWMVIFIIFLIFLYSRSANAYFRKTESAE